MIHEILRVGVLQCNCSIFGDEQTREAIVIDPGDNIPEILEMVKRHGLTVKAIVITHAHIDHIGGAHKLRAATSAPVYMNPNDTLLRDMLDVQAGWLGVETPEKVTIDTPVREGDKLVLGVTEFSVLDTPGHAR
jgi:glyoxylase-like metal-dependent hydrolase (beta-lactamase superfamily II)